jgi:hypothetical protein
MATDYAVAKEHATAVVSEGQTGKSETAPKNVFKHTHLVIRSLLISCKACN